MISHMELKPQITALDRLCCDSVPCLLGCQCGILCLGISCSGNSCFSTLLDKLQVALKKLEQRCINSALVLYFSEIQPWLSVA